MHYFKIHALCFHVGKFCKIKNKGLGAWSEQTNESLHHSEIALAVSTVLIIPSM